jgi:hypothetical protein
LAVSLVLFAAGCGSRSTPSGSVPEEAAKPALANTGKLTLRFKDWTWREWPNKVEEALSGLPGVKGTVAEYHEDSKDYKDDLHVTYDPDKLTPEQILAEIRKQEFQGSIVPGPGRPGSPWRK